MTFDLDLWPTEYQWGSSTRQGLSSYQVWRVLGLSVAQGEVDLHDLWPWPLTYWISMGVIYSSRTIFLPSLKLLGQSVLELSVAQGEVDWHDLWPWPTDLNINKGHLLIKDYLPTKFEASGAKRSWVISCTKLRDTDRHTDRPTYQLTCAKQYAPPFSKGGTCRHTDIHVQSNMPLLFQRGA